MIELIKPEKWPLDFYPEVSATTEMKLSNYAIVSECYSGVVIQHTITWGCYYLTKDEYDNILTNERMIAIKAVLDASIDEYPIAEKAYLKRSQPNTVPTYENVMSYVIMTTTNCNARCFYCYENGINKIKMSLKTADDVVQFILSRLYEDKKCSIEWFGGEPLVNVEVIDYISQKLKDNGVDLSSTIITNAYNFNDENIEKAVSLWNTTFAQITIDGPEDYYNATKNYIYKNDISPFKTVIKNIRHIVNNSNISVSIRINLSKDNIDKIEDLLLFFRKYLYQEFLSGKVNAYLAVINQEADCFNKSYDSSYEDFFTKIHEKYSDIIKDHKKLNYTKKEPLMQCMAESGKGLVVFPDGRLSNCEHWDDSRCFGNVISGITNTEIIKKYTDHSGDNLKICKETKCPLLPSCHHFIYCNPSVKCCDETDAIRKLNFRKRGLCNFLTEHLQAKYNEMNKGEE